MSDIELLNDHSIYFWADESKEKARTPVGQNAFTGLYRDSRDRAGPLLCKALREKLCIYI